MDPAASGLRAFRSGEPIPAAADLAYLVRSGPAAGVSAAAATEAAVLSVPLAALPDLLTASPALGATAVHGLLRRQAALAPHRLAPSGDRPALVRMGRGRSSGAGASSSCRGNAPCS